MTAPQQPKKSVVIPVLIAFVATVLFRLPELMNPGVVNSDSAVVGLQAMHILRGEWHWFLWGSGYQSTVDSVVAAGLFRIMGATPLALMCTALFGHLLLVLFVMLALRRRLSAWTALLLVLPLILSSAPTHTYTLHPPRQTALTIVFVAIWLLDGASSSRGSWLQFALGAALGTFACFADPYALVFLPGVALLTVLSLLDAGASRKARFGRATAALVGAAIGAIPFFWLRLLPESSIGPLTLTRELIARNWALLKGPCLQWILGTRVLHQPAGAPDYVVWKPPVEFLLIQWLGVVVFVAGLVMVLVTARSRKIPWELRRLGMMGLVTVVVTLAGFLLSVMPSDHYSSRYLVALVLVLPFIFAPVAYLLTASGVASLLAPMVLSFAVCGWLGYEPCVRGIRIVNNHWSESEARLQKELLRRNITTAMADYWAAYRLTFMFQERVTVVPYHQKQDRYAPYRMRFDRADRYAYIYDHRHSEESLKTVGTRIAHGVTDRFTVGDFDVYVIDRLAPSGASVSH